MGLLVLLIICFAGCVITSNIAGAKGRDTAVWGAFGFLFPLIAIIAASCVSDAPAREVPRI